VEAVLIIWRLSEATPDKYLEGLRGRLIGFGYFVPMESLKLIANKEIKRIERWVNYRNREHVKVGRPAQRPDFLERYKL